MGTMLFSSLEACCETNGYPCTAEPSAAPITQKPTKRAKATKRPTPVQRVSPAYSPTPSPSTKRPTPEPTVSPTYSPTPSPTYQPSPEPTKTPRREPTKTPTREPTPTPTKRPTAFPTNRPTKRPTPKPAPKPTKRPTPKPTRKPTKLPSRQPNFKAQFWYPDIHALDNRCVFGSNYEEWMDTVDHRDAYLFTTEPICCIEHNCADGPPPVADAPPPESSDSPPPRDVLTYIDEDFDPLGDTDGMWIHGGTTTHIADWRITTHEKHSGRRSFRSGDLNHKRGKSSDA